MFKMVHVSLFTFLSIPEKEIFQFFLISTQTHCLFLERSYWWTVVWVAVILVSILRCLVQRSIDISARFLNLFQA